jgi:hypothetical protein
MTIEKIRRSLAFGTTLVCVSLFTHENAIADSRKSTVTVSVTVSPSCRINDSGVSQVRCSAAAQPITTMAVPPASAGATTASSAVRTINF